MFSRILKLTGVVLITAAAVSCGESTGPQGKQTEELRFLRLAPDAPPLVSQTAAFYARVGEDRELRMYFRPRPLENDSTEFLRFRVDAGALFRRPDGSAFAAGDSILITITMFDLSRLILDFQPSGLRFNPQRPAQLKIRYEEADHDFDDDGDEDDRDLQLEGAFNIWMRENVTQPWFPLGSIRHLELDEVEADILGFTNHALAY
ncbi:MAG TPA: hypothetical protein VH638_02300 [Gemmatimonadaceae bacterium]|jgi:hypothetical protein